MVGCTCFVGFRIRVIGIERREFGRFELGVGDCLVDGEGGVWVFVFGLLFFFFLLGIGN